MIDVHPMIDGNFLSDANGRFRCRAPVSLEAIRTTCQAANVWQQSCYVGTPTELRLLLPVNESPSDEGIVFSIDRSDSRFCESSRFSSGA